MRNCSLVNHRGRPRNRASTLANALVHDEVRSVAPNLECKVLQRFSAGDHRTSAGPCLTKTRNQLCQRCDSARKVSASRAARMRMPRNSFSGSRCFLSPRVRRRALDRRPHRDSRERSRQIERVSQQLNSRPLSARRCYRRGRFAKRTSRGREHLRVQRSMVRW